MLSKWIMTVDDAIERLRENLKQFRTTEECVDFLRKIAAQHPWNFLDTGRTLDYDYYAEPVVAMADAATALLFELTGHI